MYIFRTFTGPGHFHLPYKVYITFLHNSTFPFLTPPYAILTPPYKILTPLTGGRTAKIELYQFGSLDIAKREDITDIKEMLEYDLKESAEALPMMSKALSLFDDDYVTKRMVEECGIYLVDLIKKTKKQKTMRMPLNTHLMPMISLEMMNPKYS